MRLFGKDKDKEYYGFVKCFGSIDEANDYAAQRGWLITDTQVFQHPYKDKLGKTQVCVTQVHVTFAVPKP
jgi:hypothetical protein